eukprot:PhM_4_TR427/c4_g1_i1/m.14902
MSTIVAALPPTHVAPEQQQPSVASDKKSNNSKSGNSTKRSNKQRGNARRRIEPVRFKTRMCRHFLEKGSCPFAPRCAFAHSEEEMRTVQTNASEGLTHLSKLKEYQDTVNQQCHHNHSSATNGHMMPSPAMAQYQHHYGHQPTVHAPPFMSNYQQHHYPAAAPMPSSTAQCSCPSCAAAAYYGYPPQQQPSYPPPMAPQGYGYDHITENWSALEHQQQQQQ